MALTLNVNLLFANEVAEAIAGLATIFARVLGGNVAQNQSMWLGYNGVCYFLFLKTLSEADLLTCDLNTIALVQGHIVLYPCHIGGWISLDRATECYCRAG